MLVGRVFSLLSGIAHTLGHRANVLRAMGAGAPATRLRRRCPMDETQRAERMTQAQRRDQTRAKLLDAAKELFSQHGYHRTQVMDIVTRARVSAGDLLSLLR